MNVKVIILWSLSLQCMLSSRASMECPISGDPNDYIDNPNIIDNGLFECGDPNLTTYNFTPPICWTRIPHPDSDNQNDCYAGLQFYFSYDESDPNDGTSWKILHPFEGDYFVLLSSGDMEGDPDPDRSSAGAIISQKVFLCPGDTIMGAYFFGTTDYRPYNDYASIYLELATEDPNEYPEAPVKFTIPGTQCDVDTVGSYQSTIALSPQTDGWISFSYTVEPNQLGPYFLKCEVADFSDKIYRSYYAVDYLRICRGGRPIADLDGDCKVNLKDYSIISEAWMTFCPDDPNGIDPNDITSDPNIPCQLADIDNSWVVDANDIAAMSDEWLYNTEPNDLQAPQNPLFIRQSRYTDIISF